MNNYLLIIRMAFDGILGNKLRAFLTMLGIIIGVSSVIMIMSIGAGAQSLITNSLQELGTNLVGVLPGNSDDSGPPASAFGIEIKTLTREDAEALSVLDNVTNVAEYVRGVGELSIGNRSINGNYSGVTASFLEVEGHEMAEGRFFNSIEENSGVKLAVLGADIVDELSPISSPIGQRVRINNVNFRVIGVLERKGSFLVNNPDNQIYVPIATAQKILLGEDHLGFIRLTVEDESRIDVTMDQVRKILRFKHEIDNPENDDFSVRSISQALDVFVGITRGLSFFLAAVAGISLIVGGIGITNIMLMTVKERTREIGLRKAIGARPSQIKSQFILESSVITILGGILGIIFGVAISFVVSLVVNNLGYVWSFEISLFSILLAFVFSFAVGLIFGTYPATKAANLNPIEALRYE